MTVTERSLNLAGLVLLALGGYGVAVLTLVASGIALSLLDLEAYARFAAALNPVLPALLRALLRAEAAALLVLAFTWLAWRQGGAARPAPPRTWRVGRALTLTVAAVVLVAAALWRGTGAAT